MRRVPDPWPCDEEEECVLTLPRCVAPVTTMPFACAEEEEWHDVPEEEYVGEASSFFEEEACSVTVRVTGDKRGVTPLSAPRRAQKRAAKGSAAASASSSRVAAATLAETAAVSSCLGS